MRQTKPIGVAVGVSLFLLTFCFTLTLLALTALPAKADCNVGAACECSDGSGRMCGIWPNQYYCCCLESTWQLVNGQCVCGYGGGPPPQRSDLNYNGRCTSSPPPSPCYCIQN